MDFEKYTSSKGYVFFDVMYKFIFINALWFFVSIAGLFIFTFIPATIAAFIMMKAIVQQQDFPIIKTFVKIFIKEYKKSEKLFLIFLVMGFVLWIDVRFFYVSATTNANLFDFIGFWITVLILIAYLTVFILSPLVYIYFPYLKPMKIIKTSGLLAMAFPIRTLIIVALHVGYVFLILQYIMILPLVMFLSITVLAYFSIRLVQKQYKDLNKNHEPLELEDYI